MKTNKRSSLSQARLEKCNIVLKILKMHFIYEQY